MKREVQRLFGGGLNLLAPTDKTPEGDAIDLLNFRVDQAGVLRGSENFVALYAYTLSGGEYIDTMLALGAGTGFYAEDGLVVCAGNSLNYFNLQTSTNTAIGATLYNWRGLISVQGYLWGLTVDTGTADYNSFVVNGSFAVETWLPAPPASACTAATTGVTGADYPSGTYQYYVTFVNDRGLETIAGPPSIAYTTLSPGEEIALTGIPVSSDASVVARNIYRSGGTLGNVYEVTQIADNTTTTYTDVSSDLAITEADIVLSALNEPPPPAGGLAGLYFNRMLAWRSLNNPNRLWWTQNGIWTWPGSGVLSGNANEPGNWVDIGTSDDPIVTVTIHPSTAIIYKTRSVWRLLGDPDTGILEQCDAVTGPASAGGLLGTFGNTLQSSATAAGTRDYFATRDGIFTFDGDDAHKASEKLDPAFYHAGAPDLGATDLAAPTFEWQNGYQSIAFLNGIVLASDFTNAFQYQEESQRWNRLAPTLWLSGTPTSTAITGIGYLGSYGAYYAGFKTGQIGVSTFQDQGSSYAYQTRFLDQAMPDNPKKYVELVVDIELHGSAATVYAFYDNGGSSPGVKSASVVGTITGTVRKKVHISLGPDGVLGTNISVRIEIAGAGTSGSPIALPAIHGVFIYYYVEARQTQSLTLRPFNPGPGVWQVKELAYDLNATANVTAKLLTDLPGNDLALRETDTITAFSYRRNYELPQSSTWEGRIFWITLDSSGLFQLYAARMLMRRIGVYIEDYEAAAGFVWDSMEQSFAGDVNLIKQARELEIEADLNQTVTVTLLSDLPGDTETSAFSTTITGTSAGRRFFRIPLTAGIIGRLYRLQLSGTHGYKLYSARIEMLPIGIYIEAYEAAAGAVWDSREVSMGTDAIKEAIELEFEIQCAATVTVTFYTDAAGTGLSVAATYTIAATAHERVHCGVNYLTGRLFRVVLSSTGQFALYDALIKFRALGFALDAGEVANGDLWDSAVTGLGIDGDKIFDQFRFECQAAGNLTVTLYTDLPGEQMTQRYTTTLTAGTGRRWYTCELTAGTHGRLVRVTVACAAAYAMFSAELTVRKIGRYFADSVNDQYRAKAEDFGTERIKLCKKLEVDIETNGSVTLTLSTEISGVSYTTTIANTAGVRTTFQIPLPPNIRGRLWTLNLTTATWGRLYAVRGWIRTVGEAGDWAWQSFAIEASEELPRPVALTVPPTPTTWDWHPLPVRPTPAQWEWTPWPVEPTSSEWKWLDIPLIDETVDG